MNEQWPSERHAEERQVMADTSFKTAQDFFALLSAFPNGLPRAFDEVVTWIVDQDGDLAELEQRTSSIIDASKLQTYPESQGLLMTLACAAALARTPTLQTWGRVNTHKYNSWQLEHGLGEAMMAYAEINPTAGYAYVALAKEAFAALDNFTLKSKSKHVNEERGGAWAHWNASQNKLDEIWWGLRGWHGFMNYDDELPLFQVFYQLNPEEFTCTLSGSSNPYLVSALLFVAGIGPFAARFSEWKRLFATAPVAFKDDGLWNGSVLMPLLLVEASNQLSQVRQSFRTPAPSPSDIEAIKQEVASTTELIATALAERSDAPAIVSRWTPWLMRKILGHTSKDLVDVKSSAFFDNTLIEAIEQKLENMALPQVSPEDAAPWESWCYRCVLSSFANGGHSSVPAWEAFGHEWHLAPEDWPGEKGRLLRERASLITAMSKETPGIAANLLAYPIAQSPRPGQAWIGLWNDAITLREVVEFGDADASSDEYSSRSEAGKLLLLLFRIGLAIFDQGAAKCSNSNTPEAESLVELYRALVLADCEMREIDSMLSHDEWLSVFQHLTVRRMIWEQSSDNDRTSSNFQVFKAAVAPTVADLLAEAKGNVIELIAILQSLLLNSTSVSRLKADINTALIDLPDIVHLIRRLNQYHPRKYPVDETQLQKLQTLIITAD